MSTATGLLNVARSQLGFREGPNNDSKYGTWYTSAIHSPYSWNHQPYCAMALTWCAAQTPGGIQAIGGHWASCKSWAAWARAHDRWAAFPRRGDILFYSWNGFRRPGTEVHVGLCEDFSGSIARAIEFNTTPGTGGNQADGGGCYRRARHISTIVGAFRPYYAMETNVSFVSTKFVPLIIDGAWGPKTTEALQRILGVSADGEIGPVTMAALAVWLGQPPHAAWTLPMKTALQHRIGVPADGVIGPLTVRALQRFLNRYDTRSA